MQKEDAIHLCGNVASLLKNMNERAIDLLHESLASSRVGMLTLRKIIDERIKNKSCCVTNFIFECPKCKSDRREYILRHLINTLFNIGSDNLTMLLNRVHNAKNFTLKMVKSSKKKGTCVNLSEEKKINESDMNKWTGIQCIFFKTQQCVADTKC